MIVYHMKILGDCLSHENTWWRLNDCLSHENTWWR